MPLAHFPASELEADGNLETIYAVAVSTEVRSALSEGLPIVALESTIVSHGMPWPRNLEVALAVEEIVRASGAVPATVAVIAGTPLVGLDRSELEHIAKGGSSVRKTSRRDLPYVMSRKLDGATTVSATMLLAAHVGISVFVTGGIGGVHRGGENSLDISADLTELARSPVAVVCAGAKSILDIPRTLEFLETQGVTVAGVGVDDFPAFFIASSGCKVSCRVETPREAAALIRSSADLGLRSGVLFGVPIPADAAADGELIEKAIAAAKEEADRRNLSGAALTPFLLDRIKTLTGGASLEANVRLIKNNARVGAQIAIALAQQRQRPKL